ncbi:MAG: glycosyltransferase [Phycisphaerales bacterium]
MLIPAYNEESRVRSTLLDIIETLKSWGCSSEILIADDGSTDQTASVCRSIFAEHRIDCKDRVLSLPRNMGKGAAVAHGLKNTRARWTIMLDADNSARMNQLPKLAAHTQSNQTHLVIGSRRMESSEVQADFTRVLVGSIYGLTLRSLGIKLASDTQCGFKLYSHHAAQLITAHTNENGFSFDIEHLLIAQHAGLKVPEVGILWDHVEGSKVNPIIDGLKMLVQIIKMRRPIRKSVSRIDLPQVSALVLGADSSTVDAQIESKPQTEFVGS